MAPTTSAQPSDCSPVLPSQSELLLLCPVSSSPKTLPGLRLLMNLDCPSSSHTSPIQPCLIHSQRRGVPFRDLSLHHPGGQTLRKNPRQLLEAPTASLHGKKLNTHGIVGEISRHSYLVDFKELQGGNPGPELWSCTSPPESYSLSPAPWGHSSTESRLWSRLFM